MTEQQITQSIIAIRRVKELIEKHNPDNYNAICSLEDAITELWGMVYETANP